MVNDRTRLYLPVVIALGAIALVLMGVLVFKGVQKPQNAVPSHASGTTSDATKCQGNTNPDPKCFKCETGNNKNNPVGILDFACFAKYYGKTVGTP